jgi:glycosyltransferase involved in cell wall biosynthesis
MVRIEKPRKRIDTAVFMNRIVESAILHNKKTRPQGPASFSFFGIPKYPIALRSSDDLLFVHWVQGGFVSLYKLYRLSHRIVFYAHDEWLLSGFGHYQDSMMNEYDNFVIRFLRRVKLKIVERSRAIIVPSEWLATRFFLVTSKAVHVVPNPIPEVFFETSSRIAARKNLGISDTARILFLVSDSSFLDYRKGMDLAETIVQNIAQEDDNFLVLLAGTHVDKFLPNANFIKRFGYISNDYVLAQLYSAANCTFVPSRMDNFPQTSTESQSCGTPVVVFDVGGTPETVLEPGLTGEIVDPFDLEMATQAIRSFLNMNDILKQQLIQNLAKDRWSYASIAKRFRELNY